MEEGKVQFMESLTLSAPYMVRVSIPDLNIRKGPGTDFPKTGKFTGAGIFTIVEESGGGAAESLSGKAKRMDFAGIYHPDLMGCRAAFI